jgi:hypothetical protein
LISQFWLGRRYCGWRRREQKNLGKVMLSTQCSGWLASTLEVLLGVLEDQDFVKSFREGSKVLIARRSGNKVGHFLEASVFRMGGRRGLILIPEGRGGWGWHKFSDELRKAAEYLLAMVGCGFSSSGETVKKDGKEEGKV